MATLMKFYLLSGLMLLWINPLMPLLLGDILLELLHRITDSSSLPFGTENG
jgi:hypothetical protein